VNPATALRECLECMPTARGIDVREVAVIKTHSGQCKACERCPYRDGWAGCNEHSGKCNGCRTDDGFSEASGGHCIK
jgi:hypothetical protein